MRFPRSGLETLPCSLMHETRLPRTPPVGARISTIFLVHFFTSDHAARTLTPVYAEFHSRMRVAASKAAGWGIGQRRPRGESHDHHGERYRPRRPHPALRSRELGAGGG